MVNNWKHNCSSSSTPTVEGSLDQQESSESDAIDKPRRYVRTNEKTNKPLVSDRCIGPEKIVRRNLRFAAANRRRTCAPEMIDRPTSIDSCVRFRSIVVQIGERKG